MDASLSAAPMPCGMLPCLPLELLSPLPLCASLCCSFLRFVAGSAIAVLCENYSSVRQYHKILA
jgi:hypothetical protein